MENQAVIKVEGKCGRYFLFLDSILSTRLVTRYEEAIVPSMTTRCLIYMTVAQLKESQPPTFRRLAW